MYEDTYRHLSPHKRRIVRKLLCMPADARRRLLQLEALRRSLTPTTNATPQTIDTPSELQPQSVSVETQQP